MLLLVVIIAALVVLSNQSVENLRLTLLLSVPLFALIIFEPKPLSLWHIVLMIDNRLYALQFLFLILLNFALLLAA